MNKERGMSQYAKKNKENENTLASGKKVCKVSTGIKAGWQWVDDLKGKIDNNLNHIKSI